MVYATRSATWESRIAQKIGHHHSCFQGMPQADARYILPLWGEDVGSRRGLHQKRRYVGLFQNGHGQWNPTMEQSIRLRLLHYVPYPQNSYWFRRFRADAKNARNRNPTEPRMPDADIQERLFRLHENLGHADRGDMLRMLRLGRAPERAVELCKTFSRHECPCHEYPRLHRTIAPKHTTQFNEEASLELFEVTHTCGRRIKRINAS